MRSCICLLALFVLLAGCAERDPGAGGPPPRPAALEIAAGAPGRLVDFGKVTTGYERVRRVLVRNTGDLPLRVEAPAVGSPFASDAQATELAGGAELEIAFRVVLEDAGRVTSTARIPWSGGAIDLLLQAEGVGCMVAVVERLDFGTALAGGRIERSADVSNVGAGTCTIESVAVEGTGFEVEPRPRQTLLPGSKTQVPVWFAPQGAGAATGTLRIALQGGGVHEVSLEGNGVDGCIEVRPGAIDFGTIPACNDTVVTSPVEVHNRCDVPLHWLDAWVEHPDRHVFFTRLLTSQIGPGATVAIDVTVASNVAGIHTGILHLQFREGGDVQVPLQVKIDPSEGGFPVSENFEIEAPQPVDVLVVVDDTTAMAAHADGFASFAAALERRLEGHDFHIGVTTVSSATAAGCPEAPDGRLLPIDGSEARILDRDTPDLVGTLHARLASAGACHDPASAAGLATAWRALSELADLPDDPAYPAPDDGNLGFLRMGSHLVVLFLVASDDQSADEADIWAMRYAALRGFDDHLGQPSLQVQTWLEQPSALCDGGRSEKYEHFTNLMAGTVRNLCFSPWPVPATVPIAGVPSTFYLAGWPADLDGDGLISEAAGEMAVTLDGVRVPEFTDDGTMVWSFYPSTKSLRFNEGHRPRGGGMLTLTYRVACGF